MPEAGNPIGVDDVPHPGQMEGGDGGAEPGRLQQEELGGEPVPGERRPRPGRRQPVTQALPHLLLAPVVRPPTLRQLK